MQTLPYDSAAKPSSTLTRLLPRPWPPLALQFAHVHLALQGSSVETINHFRIGSGIARQCQRVHDRPEYLRLGRCVLQVHGMTRYRVVVRMTGQVKKQRLSRWYNCTCGHLVGDDHQHAAG